VHPDLKPSKIEALPNAFCQGYDIDVLRDDLIHPLISGNKWRKLSGIIEWVKPLEQAHIVTFGGAYSNHLVATAVASKLFGIPSIGFVRGDEIRALNAFETCCQDHGMQLIHVNRNHYRQKQALFDQYFGNDPNAIMIDEGGRHPKAFIGCSKILDELKKPYDYIVLSVGTGTTMEGLVQGCIDRQLSSKIIGISSLKNNYELDKQMSHYPSNYWQIFHDYHRGKYAQSDTELITFMDVFKRQSGISLEHVYTGKMFMAVLDLIQTGYFKTTDKILCIHTGGLPQLAINYNP
jgi:1-aminocyclopropane-1-carboxylate deaminase